MNYSRDKIEAHSFADDVEKMRDFALLPKEEFLRSYSYLTEEEYDLTAADVLQRVGNSKAAPSVDEPEKQFYRIAITETYVKEVEIYADSPEAAEEMAHELCSEDKITFGPHDFDDRETECRGVARKMDLELHACYGKPTPAQEAAKASLSDQIRQAETRTTLTNTEKTPRNIGNDR